MDIETKIKLAQELEKHGSSLQEFEQSLEKIAGAGSAAASRAVDTLMATPKFLAGTALLAGLAAGSGHYALREVHRNQKKNLSQKERELIRVQSMVDRLNDDMTLKNYLS